MIMPMASRMIMGLAIIIILVGGHKSHCRFHQVIVMKLIV